MGDKLVSRATVGQQSGMMGADTVLAEIIGSIRQL